MKQKILVTRATFDDVVEKLRERYDVEDNQRDDASWGSDELRRRLADKDGVLLTGSDRVDAAILDAAPRLKAVCNIAVGYNNIDLAACTARGIAATNTPAVLDETTADTTEALSLPSWGTSPPARRRRLVAVLGAIVQRTRKESVDER